MVSEKQLEEYLKLKKKESELKEKLQTLRDCIVDELGEDGIYEGEKFTAEVKFNHEVTQAFVDFLKRTGNTHLIKETSTCDAFKEMTEKYPLTEYEKESFYVLNDSPRLFVKKNKITKARKKTKA